MRANIKAIDDSSPLLRSDAALRDVLQQGLRLRLGDACELKSLRRSPSESRSSYSIELLELHCAGGRTLEVIFKDLSPGQMPELTRQAKPSFLYDPLREMHVYERVLPSDDDSLGTPRLYATLADEPGQRFWLFVERVRGVELYQIGDFAIWERAARWLARLHARFAQGRRCRLDRGRLIHHTRGSYMQWIDRAVQFVGQRPAVDPRTQRQLERVASRYHKVAIHLLDLPTTLLHGEFFPSNVIVERINGSPPGAVRPVDWELAAIGPGVLDLAALTAGKWTDAQRHRLASAYWDEINRLSGQPFLRMTDLMHSLDVSRLHLAVQMVGWSEQWSPPPQHAHDWLGEAQMLAARLGLV